MMENPIEAAARTLGSADAGWVSRRDAALKLGTLAQEALDVLSKYREERDVDVRRGVEEALNQLDLPAPGEHTAPTNLEDLVKLCERPGRRAVSAHGNGYVVTVSLPEGREQKVRVKPSKGRDGRAAIRVYTRCGEADEKTVTWTMHANAHLQHCAFALVDEKETQMILLVRNLDRDRVDAEELKATVKEVAFYGDWLERKLSGGDEH